MEQNKKILDGVLSIADKLTNTYPQVEEGTEVPKYLIIGSMARMLLTQSDYCIDNKGKRIEISSDCKDILNNSVRKIGDIDILSFYEQGIYSNKDRLKFWSQNRPCLNISKEASQCIKQPGSKIEIQSSVLYNKKSFVKINLRGKDYYVQGLDLLLAYNVLFTARSYNYISSAIDREKCQNDFDTLYKAAGQIYNTDALKVETYELLCFYKEAVRFENLVGQLVELIGDEDMKSNIKNFVKDILRDDTYKIFNVYIMPQEQKTREEIDKIKAAKDAAGIVNFSRTNIKIL